MVMMSMTTRTARLRLRMVRSFGRVIARLRSLWLERARGRNPLGPGYDHADDRELVAKSKAGVGVREMRHRGGNDARRGGVPQPGPRDGRTLTPAL
jgi:hypothetical protein